MSLQSPTSRPYWRAKFIPISKLGPVSSEAERPAFNRVVVGSIPTSGAFLCTEAILGHPAEICESQMYAALCVEILLKNLFADAFTDFCGMSLRACSAKNEAP